MTTPQNSSNDFRNLRNRYASGGNTGVPRPQTSHRPVEQYATEPPVAQPPELNYNDQTDPFAGMSDSDVVFDAGAADIPSEWSASGPAAPSQGHAPQFGQVDHAPQHRETYSSSYGPDTVSGEDDYRVRSKKDRPKQGWRRFVSDTLRVPISKSKAEMEYDRRISMINRSLLDQKVIGVMGGKGGVGKTTATLALASTIAEIRSKPVVAITLDYNSTLAMRTKAVSNPARGDVSILDFATDKTIRHSNDIAGCMRDNKHRLSVLGTGLNPVNHDQLTDTQLAYALTKLKTRYELIFVDFGNTPNTSAFWEALKSLDALILVTSTENDSMQGTRLVENIARETGLTDLLDERTLMVINHRTPADPKVDIDHFVSRMQSVAHREIIDLPWDDHLSESGPIDLDLMSKPVRHQLILAAAITMNRLPA